MISKTDLCRTAGSRSGFTLIELLCVISLLGLLTVTSVQLILLLMRFESRVSIESDRELTWQRLEDRFREDAHQAISAAPEVLPDGTRSLLLSLPHGRQVEYRPSPGMIERIGLSGSQPLEYDLFRVGEGRVRIAVEGGIIRLIHDGNGAVERPPSTLDGHVPPRQTRVDAVLEGQGQ